jgi:hypothetical protein
MFGEQDSPMGEATWTTPGGIWNIDRGLGPACGSAAVQPGNEECATEHCRTLSNYLFSPVRYAVCSVDHLGMGP